MTYALFRLLDTALGIYSFFVIANVIISLLLHFNIINSYQQFVQVVSRFLYQVTEPALRPIRKILPELGGVDLSPLVLLLLITFVRDILASVLL